MAGGVPRWTRRLRRTGDSGVSLIELLVVLGIMGTLMVMFTTGVIQVYQVAGKTQSLSAAQSELHVAFLRLDKEIRYASWIATPGQVGQRWYVEFLGTDSQTLQPRCKQLRLDLTTGVLQLIRWTPGSPPAPGAPGQTLASAIVTDAAVLAAEPVFQLQVAGAYPYASPSVSAAGASFAPDYQRLRLRLTTRVGSGQHASTAKSDVTFTAVNTSRMTPSTNTCSEGRPSR